MNLFLKAFQSPSSMMSTNQLIQSSYALKQQQEQQQQQNLFKHLDQSKSSKKKQKKQTNDNLTNTKNANRSFALYNQQKGRIGEFIYWFSRKKNDGMKWCVENVVKNQLTVATDDADESKILDDENEPKGKWVWGLLN